MGCDDDTQKCSAGQALNILEPTWICYQAGDEGADISVGHSAKVARKKKKVELSHARISPPLAVRVVEDIVFRHRKNIMSLGPELTRFLSLIYGMLTE